MKAISFLAAFAVLSVSAYILTPAQKPVPAWPVMAAASVQTRVAEETKSDQWAFSPQAKLYNALEAKAVAYRAAESDFYHRQTLLDPGVEEHFILRQQPSELASVVN